MLRLAFVVKQWYALEDERLFLKDFSFINTISIDTNNVNGLFSYIMGYLSNEFNAGVISYRIPLLVGINREPVFYLREFYVSDKIPNREEVKERYFMERLVKKNGEIGGCEKLICKYHGLPIILAEPNDSGIITGISHSFIFIKL